MELFLVPIFLYSVQKTGKYEPEITPYLVTFHAVIALFRKVINKLHKIDEWFISNKLSSNVKKNEVFIFSLTI